jgi:hypothetical protein
VFDIAYPEFRAHFIMSDSETEVNNEIQLSVGEAAVRKWCYAKRLSCTTRSIIDLGYDSMEALSLLNEEDLGYTLPVGQKRLLLQQVKRTFPQGGAAMTDLPQVETLKHSQKEPEAHLSTQ